MNVLSIDLESWCYPNLKDYVDIKSTERSNLDNGYLKASLDFLLEELYINKIKCTFFCLAETASWRGINFYDIKKNGHEIAFHTFNHKLIKDKDILIEQLKMSEDFIGEFKPIGFRGPQFIYNEKFDDELIKKKFVYKSNKFQNKICKDNLFYGTNTLLEFPISVERIYYDDKMSNFINLNIKNILNYKFIGSGYFFPIISNKYLIKRIIRINNQGYSYHLFLHNWQIIKPKKNVNYRILLKSPFYYPYTIDVKKKFVELIKEIHFNSIENFLK